MICPYCNRTFSKFNIKQHIRRHEDPEYDKRERSRHRQQIQRVNEAKSGLSYEERFGIERAEEIKRKISGSAKLAQNHLSPDTLSGKRNKLRKHAKEHNYGGYKPGSGRGKSGWYHNIWCDSSWELAFVIYCLDHNIPLERNRQRFPYIWKDQQHFHIPDFIVDGELVEIKGFWTEQTVAKIQQCEQFIFVIDSTNINHYLNFTIARYGKSFIKLYESINGR